MNKLYATLLALPLAGCAESQIETQLKEGYILGTQAGMSCTYEPQFVENTCDCIEQKFSGEQELQLFTFVIDEDGMQNPYVYIFEGNDSQIGRESELIKALYDVHLDVSNKYGAVEHIKGTHSLVAIHVPGNTHSIKDIIDQYAAGVDGDETCNGKPVRPCDTMFYKHEHEDGSYDCSLLEPAESQLPTQTPEMVTVQKDGSTKVFTLQ